MSESPKDAVKFNDFALSVIEMVAQAANGPEGTIYQIADIHKDGQVKKIAIMVVSGMAAVAIEEGLIKQAAEKKLAEAETGLVQ